jgi:hypothetical protein
MSSNNSSGGHVLDNFPFELSLAAKLVEVALLPALIGLVVGMYRGIEINHPGKLFKQFWKHFFSSNSCTQLQCKIKFERQHYDVYVKTMSQSYDRELQRQRCKFL